MDTTRLAYRRRLLLGIALILAVAVMVSADVSYTIVLTDVQSNYVVNRERLQENQRVCRENNKAPDCTQPQARDGYCQKTVQTNAPCDGSLAVRIYSAAQTQDFLQAQVRSEIQAKRDAQAQRKAMVTAAIDALCESQGKPAGCTPDPE